MTLPKSILLVLFCLVGLIPLPALGQMNRGQPTISTALNTEALQPGQQAVMAVVLDIPGGFHSQSHTPLEPNLIPLTVTMEDHDGLTVYPPIYPEAKIEHYPALGDVSVYTGQTIIYVPIQLTSAAATGPIEIAGSVRYQICDDQSCFMPQTRPITLATTVKPAGEPVNAGASDLFAGFDPRVWSTLTPAATAAATAAPAESSGLDIGFGITLADNAYALWFIAAFVAGIIFNIVPCVLPVLPLKAIGFYEVAQHNRAKCLALGAVFSLGIVTTFGALAVLVLGMHAFEWGQLFGNPWFAGTIVVLLVGIAAGMFGLYGVVLPSRVYEFTPNHETYTGNFLFGILTAVLSTPCTFGLFFGLLIWAAAQPVWLGTLAVMTTGLGMATPYLVLSAVPELARKFPRTGPWSEVVKQMTAFLLLAVAVYFGRMFLPDALRGPGFWWVIFALVAAAVVFLFVRTIQLAPRVRPILVSSVIGLLILLPVLALTIQLSNPPMQWVHYSDNAFADARASGQPVLVKFTADWCLNCQTVEATVFGNIDTVDSLRRDGVIAIKADLTRESAEGWNLLRELNPVGAIPFTAIYLPEDTAPRKLSGIYSTSDLMNALHADAHPVATAR